MMTADFPLCTTFGLSITVHSSQKSLTERKVTARRWDDRVKPLPNAVKHQNSILEGPTFADSAILDIGGSSIDQATLEHLESSILHSKVNGERVVLPDELLYDDVGLRLWSDIIHLPDYYQFHDEVAILKEYGLEIASLIPSNAVLVDLGAGDTAKVSHLISALTACDKRTTYLALDISKKYLGLNIQNLSREHPTTPCRALWGTFTDGMAWITRVPSPRVFLSLGSVLCNDAYDTALGYLRSWAALLRKEDLILIGMDGHTSLDHFGKIWRSYHHDNTTPCVDASPPSVERTFPGDQIQGCKNMNDADSGIEIDLTTPSEDFHFARFWENGLAHANRLLGEDWFKLSDWSVRGLIEREPSVSHRFIFRARKNIPLGSTGVVFKEGDELDWFDAHKYGPDDVKAMCAVAGLQVVKVWRASNSEMCKFPIANSSIVPTAKLRNSMLQALAKS